MMARLFPMPLHSILLLIVWLMLNNSFSFGHILLGAILGFVIPLICSPLRIPQPKITKPFKVIPYVLMIIYDVIVANIEVAILVIGPMNRIKPGFVAVPLDLDEYFPITMLASTVTLTPGTVSAELSEDRKFLYVHVLNMPENENEVVDQIKTRYEARIKEIFGC